MYWIDAKTGYEKHAAFIRSLTFDRPELAQSSENWVRLSSGDFGTILADTIPSEETTFSVCLFSSIST